MQTITLISTIHKEMGKCNADELCTILAELRPKVIFLEALESTYSKYEKELFRSFGVYHQKLELKAIQKSSLIFESEYVPVLDMGLTDSFEKKYNLVGENRVLQKLLDEYNSLVCDQGFTFLNSAESENLQKELRMMESDILNNNELNQVVNEDINAYENSMIRNIITYCKSNYFGEAIFLCGVAHRNSLVKKVRSWKTTEELDVNLETYGN